MEDVPSSIVRSVVQDILAKNVGLADEIDDIPEVSQIGRRTVGRSLLTTRTRAAFGLKKFEALMSGVSSSARRGYTRLWYEWVRFSAIRRHAPWLISTDTICGGGP